MEVSNLISLFFAVGIPLMTRAFFFYFTNRNKRNYTGYLLGEEIFQHF